LQRRVTGERAACMMIACSVQVFRTAAIDDGSSLP